jgi:hypothetical protein
MKATQALTYQSLACWCGLMMLATNAPAQPQANETATSDVIRWGEPREGLSLGIEADERAGVIYCWIRNATTNAVQYNDYFLGVSGLVHVEISRDKTWQPLKFKRTGPVLSTGPSPRYNRILIPNASIEDSTRGHPLLPMRPSQPTNSELTNTGIFAFTNVFPRPVFRWPDDEPVYIPQDTPQPAKKEALFTVDLLFVKWPEEFFKDKTTKFRVVQSLCTPVPEDGRSQTKNYQLESPVIEITSSRFKELVAKSIPRPETEPAR